jgi:hypothetical protein
MSDYTKDIISTINDFKRGNQAEIKKAEMQNKTVVEAINKVSAKLDKIIELLEKKS